ncbi:hypothetical protein FisN_15Hh332 [Fistulifera solaris]|uniref:Uncharacterized protein n=1 Tax=Fistulifera solaris TaxID=1519565 RepID=A0A1Z5JFR2_FISSO|nr:hypothetical protein FisN_15Hh332 [Fistulifera solaris]|eukprot:GAX12850.1 hypothetical protein FisN_15Hh332 [Fistulifera solaris]
MPKIRAIVELEACKTPPPPSDRSAPPPSRKTYRTNDDGRMKSSSTTFLPIQSEEETGYFHDEGISAQNPLRFRALSLSRSTEISNATPSDNKINYFITASDVTPTWPLIPKLCEFDESSSDNRPRLEMRTSPRR